MGVDVLENKQGGFRDGSDGVKGPSRVLSVANGVLVDPPETRGAAPTVEDQIALLAESIESAFYTGFLVGEESDEWESCCHEFLEFL